MQITDLYQTKITCSTYNANIDSTDTVITVKLIDFNGAAVTNKSVTLTCDKGYFNKNGSTTISGTSTKSITATTNSSGEITATWTASEWGLATFSANNTKIQIRVNGWKNISVTSGTFLVNGAERLAYYYNVYSKSSASDVTITTIPSGYRVQNSIINISRVDKNIVSIIDDSGNVKLTGTGTGTCHINSMWKY